MKKRVNSEVFTILKTLVDSRVKDLRGQLVRGVAARAKIASLRSQIESLEKYIATNRYDRSEVMETEEEIDRCEQEIKQLSFIASKTDFVQNELNTSVSFYRTYNFVKNSSKLESLRNEYNSLEARADKLSDLIFACEVNMDEKERSVAVYEQANKDLSVYNEEYNAILRRMNALCNEMRSLQY